MERIYLDNAATSWPKPDSVYQAVDHAQRVLGAPAGRGGYQQAIQAMRLIEQTRGEVARLINAPQQQDVSFTFNGTDSLSTVLFGLLRKGDHVVTSVVEHNSVLRPLKHLESNGVSVTYVGCDQTGTFDESEVIDAIQQNTRLVCLIHVSNVTGSIQPLTNIRSGIQRSANPDALFLVDAAQSLGHIPVDVRRLGCDFLAAPGHKALLGPLGTGILYVASDVADAVTPFRYGGTGSSDETQPTNTPDKFESGNLNVPGIAGLKAGIEFLESNDGEAAHEAMSHNSELLLSQLLKIGGVEIQGHHTMSNRVGVFSISIKGFDCHEATSILDSVSGVQTRAGLHCAPLVHRALGTEQSGGTLRLSVGCFNTKQQIEKTVAAISDLSSVG